ncbi:MAG: methylmalonyl-CoA carboxyltransferase [Actinomycetota bacterium]|nr:methylmalonyl-CoA carboxyltransferase [Actinomycetota bacterium]
MTPVVPSDARSRPPRTQLLTQLFDPGTMQVIRSQVRPATRSSRPTPGDGVLGAAGTVARRRVFAYAYDEAHHAGSLGVAGAYTILRVLELAAQAAAPVVAFVESAGARLQEGAAALAGYGRVFREVVRLHHRVPQIAVITGTSAGGAAYAPALMDWTIFVEDSLMFLTGPAIVREAIGEEVGMAELGGARVHAKSGVADFVAEDERHATRLAQSLLSCLPQSAGAAVPSAPAREPANGGDPGAYVPAASRTVYDMREVIRAVVDASWHLECSARYARNMYTGLCRIDGRVVGVIASQPRHRGGVIDVDSARKATAFIGKCDAYGIPLVVLVDTAGFMPGTLQERAGIIGAGADLIRAFAEASVPRVTVVVRKAYGGAYITMNSKDLGAHFAFAWPDAEIGVMSARSAALIIEGNRGDPDPVSRERAIEQRAARYAEQHLSASAAAAQGLVDEVIDPACTRSRLAWALSMLARENGEHG